MNPCVRKRIRILLFIIWTILSMVPEGWVQSGF